jgi:WD40 repeat protein
MTTHQNTVPDGRKKISRKPLLFAFGTAIVLAIGGFTIRNILVHRMMLPRLVFDHTATTVVISPDGKTIVTREHPDLNRHSAERSDALVWDAQSGRILRSLRGPFVRSFGLAISPDGQQVIAGQTSPTNIQIEQIAAWDLTGRVLWTAQEHTPLSYSPDGKRIACGGDIIDAATGKLLCRTGAKLCDTEGQSAFTPDGKLLGVINRTEDVTTVNPRNSTDVAAYYAPQRLHFWHTDTGREALDLPQVRVRAFDISPDGKWLIETSDRGSFGGSDGSIVRRIDLQTGAVAWTQNRTMKTDAAANIVSIAISRNGKYAVLLNGAGTLVVVDAATGRETFRPYVRAGGACWVIPGGLAFSRDGRTLVSRSFDKVLVWDANVLQ